MGVPLITSVMLNDVFLCPLANHFSDEQKCVKLETNEQNSFGRWDGTLTFYPKQKKHKVKVEIELDIPADLGVSINYFYFMQI